jgi:hypothetical protein
LGIVVALVARRRGGGIGGGGFAETGVDRPYIWNDGDDTNVKDASQGTGCGGSDPAHADPIVLSTGNKTEVETDFTSEGEMPLSLIRYYNYYLSFSGIFGWGWNSNYDYALTSTDDYIYAWRPDGRRIRYVWAGDNRWNEEKAQSVSYIIQNPDFSRTLFNDENGVELRQLRSPIKY